MEEFFRGSKRPQWPVKAYTFIYIFVNQTTNLSYGKMSVYSIFIFFQLFNH